MNGTEKPKKKPRGISAMRGEDPSIPDPLAPYRFKKGVSGNPGGRSKLCVECGKAPPYGTLRKCFRCRWPNSAVTEMRAESSAAVLITPPRSSAPLPGADIHGILRLPHLSSCPETLCGVWQFAIRGRAKYWRVIAPHCRAPATSSRYVQLRPLLREAAKLAGFHQFRYGQVHAEPKRYEDERAPWDDLLRDEPCLECGLPYAFWRRGLKFEGYPRVRGWLVANIDWWRGEYRNGNPKFLQVCSPVCARKIELMLDEEIAKQKLNFEKILELERREQLRQEELQALRRTRDRIREALAEFSGVVGKRAARAS